MPRIDYSRICVLEELKKARDLTAEEKLELQRAKWDAYQKSYKAKPEIHNRIRICDICKEEVPEFRYQNHKLSYHKVPSFCSVCEINVKFYTNHCKTKKHQILMFIKSKCINDQTKTEVSPTSQSNKTTEEAEQRIDAGTNSSTTASKGTKEEAETN